MKRNLSFAALLILIALLPGYLSAKKVKFSVNLNGDTSNVTGVHIVGDFQTLAGYSGGDWNSGTTLMTQDPLDTNIYSVIVDIPAFAKYEYKFVNGDQFYEAEFVPVESRVGYNFNDNRWIYIDSLANDTTLVGPIVFAGNAPAGQRLVRFKVDLQDQPSVSANGVHVAGDFQGWNVLSMRMYSFGGTLYEHIGYVDSTTAAIEFKYLNGNAISDYETVPMACASNNNRTQVMVKDTVLDPICFAGCAACTPAALTASEWTTEVLLYPNPVVDRSVNPIVNFEAPASNSTLRLELIDPTGRAILAMIYAPNSTVQIPTQDLRVGLYFVVATDAEGHRVSRKLVVE
jgi:hypothetical protein